MSVFRATLESMSDIAGLSHIVILGGILRGRTHDQDRIHQEHGMLSHEGNSLVTYKPLIQDSGLGTQQAATGYQPIARERINDL
jgi:hypothetical protein